MLPVSNRCGRRTHTHTHTSILGIPPPNRPFGQQPQQRIHAGCCKLYRNTTVQSWKVWLFHGIGLVMVFYCAVSITMPCEITKAIRITDWWNSFNECQESGRCTVMKLIEYSWQKEIHHPSWLRSNHVIGTSEDGQIRNNPVNITRWECSWCFIRSRLISGRWPDRKWRIRFRIHPKFNSSLSSKLYIRLQKYSGGLLTRPNILHGWSNTKLEKHTICGCMILQARIMASIDNDKKDCDSFRSHDSVPADRSYCSWTLSNNEEYHS